MLPSVIGLIGSSRRVMSATLSAPHRNSLRASVANSLAAASMRPSRRQQVTGRALDGRGPSFRLLDVLAGKNLGTRTDFIVKLPTSRPTTHPHSRIATLQLTDANSPDH